ncbi:MAG: hypothetical protein AUI36_04905 [Cyanobacteria bacterium 13_1_40CM_2_61_4]|nr:MAG: hypothetical protein AUI36_04905 [Cyanobacteria bacterium 13_1_40CM_2_61_4]
MDDWLKNILVCPRDHFSVQIESDGLVCHAGHRYPIVAGVPLMLLPEVKQTHRAAKISLEHASLRGHMGKVTDQSITGVDEFVQHEIGATNGLAYRTLSRKLKEYPIPKLCAPQSAGGNFLDIGCNWGRWSIAASRMGYKTVGIDPNLEAILAAARVAKQLGSQVQYLVADARYLPFAERAFDFVFSYSVLQHFDKGEVLLSLSEIRRVLRVGGRSMVQMPNMFGLRSLYHQLRRRFRKAKDFEVRYWTLSEMRSAFCSSIGSGTVLVDGYFSLNPRTEDAHMLPWKCRLVFRLSDFLRDLSIKVPAITRVADSLYVISTRDK